MNITLLTCRQCTTSLETENIKSSTIKCEYCNTTNYLDGNIHNEAIDTLKVYRELLGAAFSSGEITTLAFDLFFNIYQDFTAGMTRSQKIEMIVFEAYRLDKMVELLRYVGQANPYQYNQYRNKYPALF